MAAKKAAVIIVAGGQGARMGRPKQLLKIAGKAVLERSIEAFLAAPQTGQVIVVAPADVFAKISPKYKNLKRAEPGATRLQSVISGVGAASANYNLIAVHDGARPLVSARDIAAVLAAAAKHKAAVLAAPVKDTIKVGKNGFVAKTLNRQTLWAAQTPQCYRAGTLRAALKKYGHLAAATDESQLVEKLGVKVALVPGAYANIKITTPEDLILAGALCKIK